MTYQHGSAQLSALADRTRRAVFELLLAGPLTVAELAARLPVTRPAVSQHLAVLRDARLVSVEALGTKRRYRARPDGILALRQYLERVWEDVGGRAADSAPPSSRDESSPDLPPWPIPRRSLAMRSPLEDERYLWVEHAV